MGCQKMNVAVFLKSDLHSGGGYQYESMVINLINKFHKDKSIKFKYYGNSVNVIENHKNTPTPINLVQDNIFQKIHRHILGYSNGYKILKKINKEKSYIEKILKNDEIDLVYFLSPNVLSLGLGDIPFIFTLWDLGHLDVPEFPEVSYNNTFEQKEFLYTRCLKKAYKVIVDSRYAKYNVIKRYNLAVKRIKVLKFLPNISSFKEAPFINIKKKYNINNDYVFYPAQFWPHKNHIYILRAIKILKEEKGINIDVIFCGSDKGNLEYILQKSQEYGIKNQVHYLGFVTNTEIPYLYKQCLSMVMPTYLGPTNIPPLEAFYYKVPVCYSDFPYFREQVKDAAFFINLKDPNNLVQSLIDIRDNNAVEEKILKGVDILGSWKDDDFYKGLMDLIYEYSYIRGCWGR